MRSRPINPLKDLMIMSDNVKIPLPRSLQEIVGALLFASQTPLMISELREIVRRVEPEEGENSEVMNVYHTCTTREIEEAVKGLGKALDVAGCGFQLVCSGGAYRLQSTAATGRYVRSMLKMDRPNRLGKASLETLAIVAYRQPLTKSEIEEIRGVDVSGNIKTLVDLQLVRIVGKSELPGHPFLYGTTPVFLEHFGLASLQQLNELDPTLQRSNPKLKAATYKKPMPKTELEIAAEERIAKEKSQEEENAAKEGTKEKENAAAKRAKNGRELAQGELGLNEENENGEEISDEQLPITEEDEAAATPQDDDGALFIATDESEEDEADDDDEDFDEDDDEFDDDDDEFDEDDDEEDEEDEGEDEEQ